MQNAPFQKKNALSLFQETKRLVKHSAVPLSVAVPLQGAAAHCPPSRAGAVTGTKRPRLLASSFSRRLQGDFRPASPSASHHNSGSLCGNRRVTRPFPRQMFHFTGLSYHNFFVCQGGFRKKSHVPPPALEVRAASQYSFSVSWHHSGRDPKPVVIMR